MGIKGCPIYGQGVPRGGKMSYMSNDQDSVNLSDKLIDLELAKKDNKNSKVRKYLPAVVLTAGIYYSFLWTLGLGIGYLGSKLFLKYLVESGKVDCTYIDCGKWKFHVHHWIMGVLFLLIVGIIDYFYLPRFFVGIVCGIIIQDIYDFNDWHKILVKNEAK